MYVLTLSKEGHLLCCAARARFHHAATYCCPDSNHELSNAENQYDSDDGHFCIIPVPEAKY